MLPIKKRCIKNKLAVKDACLTIGKIYDILDSFDASGKLFYYVINDNGYPEFHISEFFEDVFILTKADLNEVNTEEYQNWITNLTKL
jgi:hypothetical protein